MSSKTTYQAFSVAKLMTFTVLGDFPSHEEASNGMKLGLKSRHLGFGCQVEQKV